MPVLRVVLDPDLIVVLGGVGRQHATVHGHLGRLGRRGNHLLNDLGDFLGLTLDDDRLLDDLGDDLFLLNDDCLFDDIALAGR